MTLNYERYYALTNTREFLYSLLDPKKTPRIPRKVRTEARHCLRHYIWDIDLDKIDKCKKCREIICKSEER